MGTSSLIGVAGDAAGPTKKRNLRARARRRYAPVVRSIQTATLVAGLALLAVYAAAQVDAVRGRERALEAFAQARNERAAAKATALPAATLAYLSHPDQSLWGRTRIAAYRDSLVTHDAVPLGVLRIPAVALEAPIFEGTGELTLNRGVGRIEGTAMLGSAGNVGVAGHRDGFFRILKDVNIGDAIDVESLDTTTRYRITQLLIVEPTDVYVLEPTQSAALTLVTCYPFYFIGDAPQRYIVKAVAEESTPSAARP